MKRYGEKAVREHLANGGRIQYNEWFTLNAGYKVIDDNDEIIGFMTCDLFAKLHNEKVIKACYNGYAYTNYNKREV